MNTNNKILERINLDNCRSLCKVIKNSIEWVNNHKNDVAKDVFEEIMFILKLRNTCLNTSSSSLDCILWAYVLIIEAKLSQGYHPIYHNILIEYLNAIGQETSSTYDVKYSLQKHIGSSSLKADTVDLEAVKTFLHSYREFFISKTDSTKEKAERRKLVESTIKLLELIHKKRMNYREIIDALSELFKHKKAKDDVLFGLGNKGFHDLLKTLGVRNVIPIDRMILDLLTKSCMLDEKEKKILHSSLRAFLYEKLMHKVIEIYKQCAENLKETSKIIHHKEILTDVTQDPAILDVILFGYLKKPKRKSSPQEIPPS